MHIWQKSSIFAANFVNYLIRYLFENIRKLTNRFIIRYEKTVFHITISSV